MNDQRCSKTPQLVLWYRNFLEDGKAAAFVSLVATRYSLSTLGRMASSVSHEMRRASVLALGMLGGPESLNIVGTCLRDSDRCVRLVAEIAFADLCRRQMGTSAAQALDAICRHIDGHRYSRALTLLEEFTDTWPEFAEAWYQFAVTCLGLGQIERAKVLAQQVIDLNPNHFAARTLQARCWLEMDDAANALRSFQASFEINPSQLAVREYICVLKRQARRI